MSWAEQALGDDDWILRAQAVAALADVSAQRRYHFAQGDATTREEVRRAAADSLGRVGGKDAMAALAEGLSDQSAQVRMQMMQTIAKASPAGVGRCEHEGLAGRSAEEGLRTGRIG